MNFGGPLKRDPKFTYDPTYHMFRVGLVLHIPKGLILEPCKPTPKFHTKTNGSSNISRYLEINWKPLKPRYISSCPPKKCLRIPMVSSSLKKKQASLLSPKQKKDNTTTGRFPKLPCVGFKTWKKITNPMVDGGWWFWRGWIQWSQGRG